MNSTTTTKHLLPPRAFETLGTREPSTVEAEDFVRVPTDQDRARPAASPDARGLDQQLPAACADGREHLSTGPRHNAMKGAAAPCWPAFSLPP